MSKTEELKQELQVLTSRRDRMQQNLYEVEKRINEIVNELKKSKIRKVPPMVFLIYLFVKVNFLTGLLRQPFFL
ncbi:hypothetical protein [Peribacillus asahii]|uniref:hypothetical protein n=1 Tax=Peribacillus asahii TaxID=228899 RepID=UPI002079D8B8|nr:hypothetical protein [Peribacillus asahii]USK61738.1 hypothetical protein LIT37_10695 [Peribacillus asahii]